MSARRVCVIGAGLGGLALAIRLAAAGIGTVLVEARDSVGGQARSWFQGGFTFEDGAGAIDDPEGIAALWGLTGDELGDALELIPIELLCRFNWQDGAHFDWWHEEGALAREVVRLAPGDLAGFEEYLALTAARMRDAAGVSEPGRTSGIPAPVTALFRLIADQGWRSFHAAVSGFVQHDRLREALAFDAMLAGRNPFSAGAATAGLHARARMAGLWSARGGIANLATTLLRRFEQLGGTLRLNDPVLQIHAIGNRVSEVETQSGWRERFDAVASNADVMHSYRDLLGATVRGQEMAHKLSGRDFSPALFTVHVGIEGSWPGIPHRMVLFGPRYQGLFKDIFEFGVLPRDMIVMLDHPTITDPSLAPAGKSVFRASVPVANLGKLPVDWEVIGPMMERRVLDEIGCRLIPDLSDRIVTSMHYTPRDRALDFNAHLGSTFGIGQSGVRALLSPLRNRDARIGNFYLVGAASGAGASMRAVLSNAARTAAMILEELN